MLAVCSASGTVEHTEQCALDCFSDGSRCNQVAPSNGLGPALIQAGQQAAITLPPAAVIDSDTGTVTLAGNPIVVPTVTVAQPGGLTLRVLLAQSWILNGIQIRGTLPVAFVASDEITVQGVIDASADGHAGGPGARVCGSGSGGGGPAVGFFEFPPSANSGGYPRFLWASNGVGGGGFGTTGGAGGVRNDGLLVGTAGLPNGNPELVPLRGGCEGGESAQQASGVVAAGAGGGAIQLVGGRAVHLISDSANIGVVHVGGGRGIAGVLGSETSTPTHPVYGPGGAGSGGGILIEAPTVVLDDGTALVAAGGGGGGYGACTPAPDGNDASPDAVTAGGGACSTAATPAAAGGDGATNSTGATGANATFGAAGSGGGGLGRIRINTADGQYSASATALVRGVTTTGMVGRR
jgi:hypothetical protein